MIQFHSNEKRDLSRICYARAGSYFYLSEDYFKRILRITPILSGDMTHITDMSFYVRLLRDKEPVRYHYYGDAGSLRLIEPIAYADLALTDENQIRLRGQKGAGIRFDLASNIEGNGACALDSFARLKDGSVEGVFGKHGYLRFKSIKGSVEVCSKYDMDAGCYSQFEVSFLPDESGCFDAVIHNYREEFLPVSYYLPFETVRAANVESYEAFRSNYKNIPEGFEDLAEDCMYVTWSHVLKPGGFVKTPMILFHYNALAAAFSWQQSYNGMALLGNPAEGFRLITNMLLYQNPVNGAVPGGVGPENISDGGIQPPLQGFALDVLTRICGEDFITKELAEEYLPKLVRWVNFWTTYRTAGREDDLIAINNPNESGWDDASNYSVGFPASNADTIALLIETMYACEILARRAGLPEEEKTWKARGDALLHILTTEFWNGSRFVTRVKGEIVESKSLACYIPVMLANRLPAEIVDACVEGLFKEGEFLTPIGLCSESMTSPLCHWGWHFVLGRVVAPQQMYIALGLYFAGKKKEARVIAERWCKVAQERGIRLGYKPFNEYPLTQEPADMLIEPECGDGWSWCGWSACCTMSMLQIVLGDL